MAERTPTEEAVATAIRMGGRPWKRDAVNALISAMWSVPHDKTMSRDDMLNNLSLLTGMAVAALMEFKNTLPKEEAENEQPQADHG